MNKLINRRSFLLGLACYLALPIKVSAQQNNFEPFSFAFVTDVHLANDLPDSYILTHESQLFLQETVKQLNKEKLDFVIFGGDQVETLGKNQENWQLFLDIVQTLNMPWSFILGEKDIIDELDVDKMSLYGADWKARGIVTNKPYWSQDLVKNVHIIGLDTSVPHFTNGDISPMQLKWLKKDLENNQDKFVILVSHHPILPPPPFDSGPPWDDYILTQGAAVREILGSYSNVHLAINGHVHVNKIQQEKYVWYISCGSLDVYPCVYKVFTVTPENICVQTRQLNFPGLIKKARKELAESNLAYNYNNDKPVAFVDIVEGDVLDQDATLSYSPRSQPKPLVKQKSKNHK